MKDLRLIKQLSFLFILLFFAGCNTINSKITSENNESFTFVFMTDIHLQPEKNAVEGFNQAIDSVNKLNPDFVITGGDLVMDVLGQDFERSEMLFNLYNESLQRFNMPVYNTMGNHEIFGIYKESGVESDHPEYGEKMFEKRIGKRYYSFDHKGWHFIILDGVEDTRESSYIGKIDSVQMEWIKSDLERIDFETPIAVSVHIPFITSYMQILYGSLKPNNESLVITNAKEVLDLFKDYNLKLALQGHLHFLEDIYTQGIHFVTGGAVSSRWWQGKEHGMEEGFLLIKVSGDDFEWEYVDYGWEVEEE
jgi:3',5'-cyclic AMP phosphodiesterase CpdA